MPKTPVRYFLKDYQVPNFKISQIHLTFDIQDPLTFVTNRMQLVRQGVGALTLTGPSAQFKKIFIKPKGQNEKLGLEGVDFNREGENLTLNCEAPEFELCIHTELNPAQNTALLGLYQTGTGLCTQCEPEGFRNITYFLDRPDVMTRYRTKIIADKKKYPLLLSNGNRILHEELPEGRHLVEWEDPFPKPSYLFALVAGDYGSLKDQFVTMSGRTIDLELYCEHGEEYQCSHALEALKRSMRWDEAAYGREYDLGQYMILAVDDFNGGAMENKGLNIFNSRLIFADSKTATDDDFERVESVIAHEYFHNWTGNRITLRDWFQLSLKEGLTVFREQHYMCDMASESLRRIDNVSFLRDRQFPEDAGPNAHPVRPESCLAVDNFYTVTVYEKGAEVIRVLKQLLGDQIFHEGMDYYFKTFDGHSITIEDFLSCFEKVSGKDLTQFKRWYTQSGTPNLKLEEVYDSNNQSYRIRLEQSWTPSPATSGTEVAEKKPFVIPIKLSLYSPKTNQPISLHNGSTETVIELTEKSKEWTFENCTEKPIPSILRGMTAPVNLEWNASREQLEFLSIYDNDGFNQWESLQKISLTELTKIYSLKVNGETVGDDEKYLALFENILENSMEKPELTSRLLQLPSYEYLVQKLPLNLDPIQLSQSFDFLRMGFVKKLNEKIWIIEDQINRRDDPNSHSFEAMGLRKLRAILWKLLGTLPDNRKTLAEKYKLAKTMNDQAGIIEALNSQPSSEREECLNRFIDQWKDQSLLVNKWLTWKSTLNDESVLETVKQLSQGIYFKASNPNKVRALYGAFAGASYCGFHRMDGAGYQFFSDCIKEVDALNPSTAARLCQGFENWYRLEPKRKKLIQSILIDLVEKTKLSKNSFEILKRSLEFDNNTTSSKFVE